MKSIVVRASCSLEISGEQDARTPEPHKYENCYIKPSSPLSSLLPPLPLKYKMR